MSYQRSGGLSPFGRSVSGSVGLARLLGLEPPEPKTIAVAELAGAIELEQLLDAERRQELEHTPYRR